MPVNIFYDHNSIVNEHARAQSQPAQRHNIQGQSFKVHKCECRQYGNGNRQPYYQRHCPTPQRDQKHENRQKRPVDSRCFDFAYGIFDKSRLVFDCCEVHAAQVCFHIVYRIQYRIDHGDCIAAGFFVNGEANAFLSIEAHDGFSLLIFQSNRAHVAHAHRHAVSRNRAPSSALFSHNDFPHIVDVI